MSTERAAAPGRNTLGHGAAVLLLLAGFLIPIPCAATVPLTPWGVAPQVYTQSTHPDSIEGSLASAGNLEHRPLALAAAMRGLEAAESGNHETACAYWEQARALDPTYATPTLAPWRFSLQQEPEQALRAILGFADTFMFDFKGQQLMATNTVILTFFPLLLAVIVCSLLIFAHHSARLHHLFWEHLDRFLPRPAAKWVVWGLFMLPLFWNLGWFLWSALLLAAAFPLLLPTEKRFAFGALALLIIVPFGLDVLSIVAAPAEPSHLASSLWRAQRSGRSPQNLAEIRILQDKYPEEGALYFTESLLARQAGDLATARRTLEQAAIHKPLPQDRFDAAQGILAYKQGDVEAAIRHFLKAAQAAPDRFSVRYNLSKSYARASLFLKADREMRRAFELNADKVRREGRRRLQEQAGDLIEERLGNLDLWKLLARRRNSQGFQLPTFLALLFPGGNPRLLWLGILLLPLLGALSTRWHRRLHTHTCSQCGKIVCRKCLRRRERRVYCTECALTAGRWASLQNTQLLLTKLLGRHDRPRDRVLDMARFVIPGLGAMLRGHVDHAFLQILVAAGAILWLACGGLPVKPLPWSGLEDKLLLHTGIGLTSLVTLLVWILYAELHGLRRRTHLKEFLGSARPRTSRARVA